MIVKIIYTYEDMDEFTLGVSDFELASFTKTNKISCAGIVKIWINSCNIKFIRRSGK